MIPPRLPLISPTVRHIGWPTIAVALTVYGGWIAGTLWPSFWLRAMGRWW